MTPAEVHIARPCLVERESVSTETFARRARQPLAAVAVFQGDDKIDKSPAVGFPAAVRVRRPAGRIAERVVRIGHIKYIKINT